MHHMAKLAGLLRIEGAGGFPNCNMGYTPLNWTESEKKFHTFEAWVLGPTGVLKGLKVVALVAKRVEFLLNLAENLVATDPCSRLFQGINLLRICRYFFGFLRSCCILAEMKLEARLSKW
jgi:hypothetical protein